MTTNSVVSTLTVTTQIIVELEVSPAVTQVSGPSTTVTGTAFNTQSPEKTLYDNHVGESARSLPILR